MVKRILSLVLSAAIALTWLPSVPAMAAEQAGEVEIANNYLRVTVSKRNGGYVIATKEGDILKKSDNDIDLTHRGNNMDTSFTSFRVEDAGGGAEDYIFGNNYGFLGLATTEVQTRVDPKGQWITSTWAVDNLQVEQTITLENADASEKLGTAHIAYKVTNNTGSPKSIKSRILMDTQLGSQDYGYYELPMQVEGQGVRTFSSETSIYKGDGQTIYMPADYFVRDTPDGSQMVGFGINSANEEERPYRMTFAHWANIAATKFDYEPDPSLHFVNHINGKKTGDSAAALYYDLGSIPSGESRSFSTYYGVTANLRNKDNEVIINTSSPARMELTADKQNYVGYTGKPDSIAQVNVHLKAQSSRKNIRAVVYTRGITAQKMDDSGQWTEYTNTDPSYFEIKDIQAGQEKVNYFYFRLKPQERSQLGSFIIKVYDMDPAVNELGAYADEFLLGTTENFVVLPGTNKSLPAITLHKLEPAIVYNDNVRYLTVTGQGVEFFQSELLEAVELRGENGSVYNVPLDGITYEQVKQGETPKTATFRVTGYMEPGPYHLHFKWREGTNEPALNGVPTDFTSSAMLVHMSADEKYRNDHYGVLAIVRKSDNQKQYEVKPYANESLFERAINSGTIQRDDVLLTLRGRLLQDTENKGNYRMLGKQENVTINHILNYHGSDFRVESGNGTVNVLMDGKITSIGANTTVRNGTAAFRLKAGTEYIVPVYDERGEILRNGALSGGQDFVELKWDNAFDVLTTVGGFLIDLRYGVLGKIQDNGSKLSDIISFGGMLDLSFVTPGAAAKAREAKKGDEAYKWKVEGDEIAYDDEDGFGFGLDFDDTTGEIRSQTQEVDVPPSKKVPKPGGVGAAIHNVMFGGKDPGFVGINMDAHVGLPHICSFLPERVEAELGINTIGGYQVSFDGQVEMATLQLGLSLVIKSNPSGAPIPDKLFFKIGNFEPGLNVDGMGVFWLTGGGGGFDKLYETIYGTDGLPPLTLLMNVQFDIAKIMTGEADLSLSLHGVSIEMSEVCLKKVDAIKFLDGGKVAIRWYPNFGLNLEGKVAFLSIMKGGLRISAAAGAGVDDFVEFVLTIAIGLPDFIPFVGGMELASAELGGSNEKIWGALTLLEIIRVTLTYYWGGDVEFTWGDPEGDVALNSASARRSYEQYRLMKQPRQVGNDPNTGEPVYVSVGGNLSFAAGSETVTNFDALLARSRRTGSGLTPLAVEPVVTKVASAPGLDRHLVTFGEQESYFINISPKDSAQKLTTDDYKRILSVEKNGAAYGLKFYEAPRAGINASETAKEKALEGANVNVVNGAACLMIPATDVKAGDSFLLSMKDHNAYDVAAILVNPVSELTSQSAVLSGHELKLNWTGKNLSDTAEIVAFAAAEGDEGEGVVLNTETIQANKPGGTASIQLPEQMASGKYRITLAISDEGKCFTRCDAGTVELVDSKAPAAPQSVTVENAGNHKLKVNAAAPAGDFDGYFVDVYETAADGTRTLTDAALFFEKGQEIVVGGEYVMPVTDAQGNPVPGPDGQAQTRVVGYTPGKQYSVEVRAGNIEDTTPDVRGDEVFHYSPAAVSQPVALKDATPPRLDVAYSPKTGNVILTSDVVVNGELYVDGNIEDEAVYSFTGSKNFTKKLDLPDGEHTFEFHAVDTDGDSAIYSEVISVDTTAPVVLLESPANGGTFSGKSLHILGAAEDNATYIFRINGREVLRGSDMVESGRLDCTLDIPKSAAALLLEIEAVDEAGNSAVQTLKLTNRDFADLREVSLLCNGKPVSADGKLLVERGKAVELSLVGKLPDGTRVDLTNDPAVSFNVMGGSAELWGHTLTVRDGGEVLVMGSFDLGGGQSLTDGMVLTSVDRFGDLRKVVEEGRSITDRTHYTAESWDRLQAALTAAEAVLDQSGATDEAIRTAQTDLRAAIRGLDVVSRISVTETGVIIKLPSSHITTVLAAGYDASGRMIFVRAATPSKAVNGVLTIEDPRFHKAARVRVFYLDSGESPMHSADSW